MQEPSSKRHQNKRAFGDRAQTRKDPLFSMLPVSGLDGSSGLFCKDMGPCGHTGLKHLAKKCVKDAGPCFALCVAGAAVALLAVLGPFDVLRSASSLHVIIALAAAMMTGGVLDLIFWVLDPFGWKNEG